MATYDAARVLRGDRRRGTPGVRPSSMRSKRKASSGAAAGITSIPCTSNTARSCSIPAAIAGNRAAASACWSGAESRVGGRAGHVVGLIRRARPRARGHRCDRDSRCTGTRRRAAVARPLAHVTMRAARDAKSTVDHVPRGHAASQQIAARHHARKLAAGRHQQRAHLLAVHSPRGFDQVLDRSSSAGARPPPVPSPTTHSRKHRKHRVVSQRRSVGAGHRQDCDARMSHCRPSDHPRSHAPMHAVLDERLRAVQPGSHTAKLDSGDRMKRVVPVSVLCVLTMATTVASGHHRKDCPPPPVDRATPIRG